MSAVEDSMTLPRMVPRPPVPGAPIDGTALCALTRKLLLPLATRLSGLRIDATARLPTITSEPSVYCATTLPPSVRPTWSSCAGGEPFCELAAGEDFWPNCVIRPTWSLVYGSH